MNYEANPSSLYTAIEQIRAVAALLRAHGDIGWAEKLEQSLAEMTSRYATKEALFNFDSWCHGKALGDTAAAMKLDDWAQILNQLYDACAIAFNELEQSDGSP